MTAIDPRLASIADAHPYPLVFATVSGAHLYGFPSPDSDWDLRGVHLLPPRELLGLPQVPDLVAAKLAGAEGGSLSSRDLAFHVREVARLRSDLERASAESELPELPCAQAALPALGRQPQTRGAPRRPTSETIGIFCGGNRPRLRLRRRRRSVRSRGGTGAEGNRASCA